MSDIKLVKAGESDAAEIWEMQKSAFIELLEKYGDYETSPAAEPLEKVILRLKQTSTYFYFIILHGQKIGAIRVVDKNNGEPKRISPLFILQKYRNHGYAREAISQVETLHGENNWELDTILQEDTNCRLYERAGYIKTVKLRQVNEKMTLVVYKK